MKKKNQNEDDQKKKNWNDAIEGLFNTIGSEDVLFKHNGENWYLGERKLDEGLLRQYGEEAEIILKFGLWKEVVKCIQYLTNRQMYLQAKTIEDITAGKLVLYTLKNINDILATAAKLKK